MVKQSLIFLVFFVAVCFITRPLIFHLSSFTFGVYDELLVAWVMNWNIHAVFTKILEIFNTNTYYPYTNTLAYSDTQFLGTILGYIPYLFLKEPITVYNTNIILSLTLTGFCCYYLVYRLTRSIPAGVISGFLVIFSSYTLSKFMHPQLLTIFFVPLSILFFIKYTETKKIKYFFLTCITFILQTYNSFLPGYFILFSLVTLIIFQIKAKIITGREFLNKAIVAATLLTGFILIPLITPYLAVSREFKYVRDIRDAIHFANRVEYSFYPSDRTNLSSYLHNVLYKNDPGPYYYDGYISAAFYLLLIAVFILRFAVIKKQLHPYFSYFTWVGFLGWIISLGPALQWRGQVIKEPFIVPLPYAVFYYLIPGFNGLRNSARWEMLMLIALSISIGLGLATIFSRYKKYQSWVITGFIITFILWEVSVPYKFSPLPQIKNFPPEYTLLQSFPVDSTIIEAPWYSPEMLPYAHVEKLRHYYSTAHFLPMVNGSSGFSPPPWQTEAHQFMKNFPNPQSIAYLQQKKIKFLVLHNDEYDQLHKNKFSVQGVKIPKAETIMKILKKNPDVKILKSFPQSTVYEITY